MCSTKEVQINISSTDSLLVSTFSCQCLFFLSYQKRNFTTDLQVKFFATTIHYKVSCNLSKQVKYVSKLNLKNMYDRRLGASPKRPIIWPPGRPAIGSCRHPVDVPIQNFCIFVFSVKNCNRCVKQKLLHLKNPFSLNYKFFCWSPKSPLRFPWRSRMLGPLGDLQGTSSGHRVPAGNTLNVKLSNSQLNKLKSGIKNKTEVTLKIYQMLLEILMMKIIFRISFY